MSYANLDDNFADSPKLLRAIGKAGDSAGWVWVRGITYCNRHLTDGFVPREAVPGFTVHPDPQAVARALVEAGAWELAEGGYQVHDFLDWNDSREEVLAKRAARTAQRVAAGRSGGQKSAASRRDTAAVKRTSSDAASARFDDAKQTPSEPQASASGVASQNRSPLLSSPPEEISPDPLGGDLERPCHARTHESPPPEDTSGGPVAQAKVPDPSPATPSGLAKASPEQVIRRELESAGSRDPGRRGPLAPVATEDTIRRLASQAAPGSRLELDDVLGAIRDAGEKERARLDVHEPPRPIGELATMVHGFVKRAQRGEARRKAEAALPPPRASPHGRDYEDQVEREAAKRRVPHAVPPPPIPVQR